MAATNHRQECSLELLVIGYHGDYWVAHEVDYWVAAHEVVREKVGYHSDYWVAAHEVVREKVGYHSDYWVAHEVVPEKVGYHGDYWVVVVVVYHHRDCWPDVECCWEIVECQVIDSHFPLSLSQRSQDGSLESDSV